jgi:hypothetical protein
VIKGLLSNKREVDMVDFEPILDKEEETFDVEIFEETFDDDDADDDDDDDDAGVGKDSGQVKQGMASKYVVAMFINCLGNVNSKKQCFELTWFDEEDGLSFIDFV